MTEQTPRNLPWLEKLAIHIPGYGGYLDRGNRRAADQALRDAVARLLGDARTRVELAIRDCMNREQAGPSEANALERQRSNILTEVSALERVRTHIDRLATRVRSAGSGTDSFYTAGRLDAAKADTLHAFDMQLYELAKSIKDRFDEPDTEHDFLAHVEADLKLFEHKLDERGLMLQGIR